MVLLAAAGVDVLTSITAVVACMFNIGRARPGRPAEHYGTCLAVQVVRR